ncbi:hypothetical protein [Kitasatospora sp. DSM 101779]|uniref:hypothetical protein n=1 Tax=Kitasatospora sp. DSM 101779 TaxID=2853165 RepID=UPI0021D97BFE|nr:hypothetical protein [Kitasatospora sp. DSM 101779]MCU7820329.1 hypothetical protein [Kitasatospora sp. DSM 101779]
MRVKKLVAAAAVAGSVLTVGLSTAAPAMAAPAQDCTYGQVCLYYNSSSYGYGAVYIQTGDVSNYAGKYFSGGANGSSGSGVEVKNHAASVDSWIASNFRVYYNSGYDCSVACQTVAPYASVNLNSSLKNNNASGRVV